MRIAGPDLDALDAQGDAYAQVTVAAIEATLRATAKTLTGTSSVDDLAPIRRHWRQHVEQELLPHLHAAWVRAADAQHRELTDAQIALTSAAAWEAGIPSPAAERAAEYLATARNRLVGIGDETWGHARDSLLEGFKAGESIPKLRNRVIDATGVAAPRATVIARTEVIGASNRGSLEQVKAAGLPGKKTWLATAGPRTRKSHAAANHQTVDLTETFTVGGHTLDGPHDPAGPPGETINCRCTLTYDLALLAAVPAQPDPQAVPLAADQYAMLTPGRKRALKVIEQALGTTRQGKNTFDVLKSFTEKRGGVTRLRALITTRVRGGELSAAQRLKADDFIGALNGYDTKAVPQLYRGIGIKPKITTTENAWFDAFEAQYRPGSTVDLEVSSFTSSARKAQEFMRSPGGSTTGTRGLVQMRVVVDGEVHALPVETMSKFASEKEWLAGGRFTVTSFDPPVRGGREYYELHIKQVASIRGG